MSFHKFIGYFYFLFKNNKQKNAIKINLRVLRQQ